MTRAEAFSTASGSVRVVRQSATSYIIYGPHDAMKPNGATTSANRTSYRDANRFASGWKAFIACRLLGMSVSDASEVDVAIWMTSDALPWRQEVRQALAGK